MTLEAKLRALPLNNKLLLLTGVFLFLDSLVIRGLTFDYSKLGLSGIDPYVTHGWIGFIFILVALYKK